MPGSVHRMRERRVQRKREAYLVYVLLGVVDVHALEKGPVASEETDDACVLMRRQSRERGAGTYPG